MLRVVIVSGAGGHAGAGPAGQHERIEREVETDARRLHEAGTDLSDARLAVRHAGVDLRQDAGLDDQSNVDFRGTPTGIDVRLVVQTGILPQIDTGMAHREPGVGQVGAGLVKPPRVCFDRAFDALVQARRAGAGSTARA